MFVMAFTLAHAALDEPSDPLLFAVGLTPPMSIV
jgi:hypothetical protein